MGKQNSEILAYLFAHAEQEYGDFNCRIVHTVSREAVIGVRTPVLRQYAKQYDAALPYVTTAGTLEEWTRRKAIQKARESYRITPEQKQKLKSANFPT